MSIVFPQKTSSAYVKTLERALLGGWVWLLLGLFILPTSKLYHQGIIAFFWLPGFLLVIHPQIRSQATFDKPLLILFGLSALWAALSVVWGGNPSQLKEIAYLLLSINAIALLAALDNKLLWKSLAWSAFVAGLLAWAALINCYIVNGNPWSFRAVGMGSLEHPILATHVMGILCLALVNLRRYLPRLLRKGYWVIPCSGYLVFLLMSKTKGTLLAMILCLTLSYLWKPIRRSLMLAAATLSFSVVVLLMFPHELLRDGFSLRPELFHLGLEQLAQHPWLGIGVDTPYWLTVQSSGATYEHAHNFYLHLAIELGIVGLVLWGLLSGLAVWRAWSMRYTLQGRAVCALFCFGCIALITDGTGPWVKPREEWFSIWLPIFLAFALKCVQPSPVTDMCCHPNTSFE